MQNTGILLAAFGSSNPLAHQTLARFETTIRQAFPNVPVRWAFTSGIIRRKLADKGKKTDSVVKALEKMRFERFRRVAVQSLHVIPGREFNELQKQAMSFDAAALGEDGFERIMVGAPLLSNARDIAAAAAAVLRHIPAERAPNEAVVLMGHGTWHEGDAMYQKLSDALREKDGEVYIGTMDGAGSVEEIARVLSEKRTPVAWLMPLLAVVGAHALHDMAGDHDASWKSVLHRHGVPCVPVLRSAVEYDGLAAIWVEHLQEVMRTLTD